MPALAYSAPNPVARCAELYTVWWTYDQDPVFLHTGEKAQVELAVYRCQNGHSDEGIHTLEDVLRHGRFDFPQSPESVSNQGP